MAKTRRQLDQGVESPRLLAALQRIVAQDGWQGLFRGKGENVPLSWPPSPSPRPFLTARAHATTVRRCDRALAIGIAPRVLRTAPACAIMIGSYEVGKVYFTEANRANAALASSAELGARFRPIV